MEGAMGARWARRIVGIAMVATLAAGGSGCQTETEVKYPDRCPQTPARGVEWSKCQLRGEDLRGVDLRGALIHNVDLGEADLTGANLSGASVANTEFKDAILFDADLSDTLFSGGDIHLGKFCRTKMPDGQLANGDC